MYFNQSGLDLLRQFEQFRSAPYKDQGGKLTIGYGHLIKAGESFTAMTQTQGNTLLAKDVGLAEAAYRRRVKVDLNENQYAAVVCWIFNLGEGNLQQSTLLTKLNAQAFDDVPGEILRWHRVDNKPSRGLIRRRAAEAMLFLLPV